MNDALNEAYGVNIALDDSSEKDGVDPYGYTDVDLRMKTAAAIHEFCQTTNEQLDENEGMADRLKALFIGIADRNKDGEISDDESTILEDIFSYAYDFLYANKVSQLDIKKLLEAWDEDVADRVCRFLKTELSVDSLSDINSFAFANYESPAMLDDSSHFKKVKAVRKGKLVLVNKRISGKVKLSAKQRQALDKARLKSHGATATLSRKRSMRVRNRLGMD